MKVIYNIGAIKRKLKNAVLAIGVFDGIHIGHQKLIKSAVKKAKAVNGQAIVLTFFPHPVEVLQPKKFMPHITSLSYRLKLIEELDVAMCVVVKFTKKFSAISPRAFIERYIVNALEPKEVMIGEDFRFGKNREGTLEYLKEEGTKHGFKVNVISSVKGAGKKIGSSQIRHLISDGKLEDVKKYLGRNVSILGKVVRGNALGKKLGFPTANINPDKEIMPPCGVYAVRILVGKKTYNGMANIGHRPSIKRKKNPINIEVHLFDFKRDLYGKKIIVEFVKRLRDEKKFTSLKNLQAQIVRDEKKARQILSA